MCFSAPVSFVSSAVLGGSGALGLRKLKEKKEIWYALIPFFFGFQQLSEGMVWLSLLNGGIWAEWNWFFTYVYSLFSHLFWPVYVPFAVWMMEPSLKRKLVQKFLLIPGVVTVGYLLFGLATSPIVSCVVGNSIQYQVGYRRYGIVMVCYLVAVCGSMMASSFKWVKINGVVVLLLFGVAYWFYTATFYSMWCFLSAISSVLIYLHLRRKRGKNLL